MEFSAKKHVYLTLATKSIFHNIEAWTNLRLADKDKLECIQGKMLRSIFGLPKATPYWGILYELDILPVHLMLTYRKLMLYHNLVNSNKQRVCKQIVERQEKLGHKECWYGNITQEAAHIGITLNKDHLLATKKSAWKQTVKKAINDSFEQEFLIKKGQMTKLRFLKKKGIATFLDSIYNDDARMAMKIRLNVLDSISRNFGRNRNCELCGDNDNSTEHVFLCNGLDHHDLDISDLYEGNRMDEVIALFRDMEKKKKKVLIDSITVNSNIIFREEGRRTAVKE